jgi:general secretion pathway protein K
MVPDAPPGRRDGGYALVAAVTAVAAFAYLAFQVLAANQGDVAAVSGRLQQARLSAAADAGLALAIHGLGAEDRGVRWSIDGRPRQLDFHGIDLTVTVEDERGKAPLAGLNDEQARALFAGGGASGGQLDALVREFRDWQSDQAATPDLASDLEGPAGGPPVRHGPFRTVQELAGLKDMDRAIFARIAPAATVFFEENGPFEPGHATALAKATMSADVPASADDLAAEASIDQQRPEEDLAPDDHYIGRTLTVRVVARDRSGGQTHRMEIVELTGDKTRPFWVRYVE